MVSTPQRYALFALLFVVVASDVTADNPVYLGRVYCEPNGGAGQVLHCVNSDAIHIPPHVTKVQLRWATTAGWGPDHTWDQFGNEYDYQYSPTQFNASVVDNLGTSIGSVSAAVPYVVEPMICTQTGAAGMQPTAQSQTPI